MSKRTAIRLLTIIYQFREPAISGAGEPTLVGQPMGLLLLLTYSATEV